MQAVLGIQNVTFTFPSGSTSTVTKTLSVTPPSKSETAIIMLSGFEVDYSNNQEYGFGELQVAVNVLSTQSVQATVTCRDNNQNKRTWEGSVNAVVMFLRSLD